MFKTYIPGFVWHTHKIIYFLKNKPVENIYEALYHNNDLEQSSLQLGKYMLSGASAVANSRLGARGTAFLMDNCKM